MQKLNTVLIVLLAAAVIYLFSTKNSTPEVTKSIAPTEEVENDVLAPMDGRIAYVNIDTLNAKYDFLDDMKKELDAEQERARSRMTNKLKKAQARAVELQEQVQTMTEQQYYAAQEELQQLEVQTQAYQERLASDLGKMENQMAEDLNDRIGEYLKAHNMDLGYDYILGYQTGGQVLFGKKAYDITDEVVSALNSQYQDELAKAEEADEEAETAK